MASKKESGNEYDKPPLKFNPGTMQYEVDTEEIEEEKEQEEEKE
jgi:hypothetical protein